MSGLVQGYVWLARLPDGLQNPQAKAVLARIADGVNDVGEGVRPLARSWIAEDVAFSESSVKRWLARLRDSGLLSSEGGGAGRGDAPIYRIDVEMLASLIPESRRPAAFRSGSINENKGVTGDPLSEKRGSLERKKGVTDNLKGGHSCDPHYTSTRNSTVVVERAREDSILEAWRSTVGEARLTSGDLKRLRDSIGRNGEAVLLEAIDQRKRSPFLRGEVGAFDGMPLSWLWDDAKLGKVARGEYSARSQSKRSRGVVDGLRTLVAEAAEQDRARGLDA